MLSGPCCQATIISFGAEKLDAGLPSSLKHVDARNGETFVAPAQNVNSKVRQCLFAIRISYEGIEPSQW